jgi:hypothetical protein
MRSRRKAEGTVPFASPFPSASLASPAYMRSSTPEKSCLKHRQAAADGKDVYLLFSNN